MNILVTGSTGFVGRAACLELLERGFFVRAFSRYIVSWPRGIEAVTATSLLEQEVSDHFLKSIDCILHLAGRAHVMRESFPSPIDAFKQSNFVSTMGFARKAAMAGVRRFVFVSSIKVNGECTPRDVPFTENDGPNPVCPYGISKYEAERALVKLGRETGMEIVIVRPPLIYGPNVKGNFRSLMSLLSMRLPLPLGALSHNRRSLVSLDNFLDFLYVCITSPAAANQLFLVSDQQDVSTVELLEGLGSAMGAPARLFSVPPNALKLASVISSKRMAYQRLSESLVVDSSLSSRVLGWYPPLDLEEGLRRVIINTVV